LEVLYIWFDRIYDFLAIA